MVLRGWADPRTVQPYARGLLTYAMDLGRGTGISYARRVRGTDSSGFPVLTYGIGLGGLRRFAVLSSAGFSTDGAYGGTRPYLNLFVGHGRMQVHLARSRAGSRAESCARTR
eukprot:1360766-Rhodomonas_salina.2